MSIYKPVSSITRAGVGTLGSVLSSVAGNLGLKLGNNSETLLSKLGNTALQASLNLGVSELTRRVANPTLNWAHRADEKLAHIARKGLKTFGLNAFNNESAVRDSMRHAGNLSMYNIWENYHNTNPDLLSRKNFYILEVNDRSDRAPTNNGHKHSMFNLLATSLSFNSFDISGESVQVGAIELDKLSASTRTTMNLTMLDDEFGTIKRWAEHKSQTMASSDGTFMPPSYYVFDVRVVFSTNVALSDYYEQIYTMRVQSMPHELSRTDQGLEEIQLVFAQADTCMPHWL